MNADDSVRRTTLLPLTVFFQTNPSCIGLVPVEYPYSHCVGESSCIIGVHGSKLRESIPGFFLT